MHSCLNLRTSTVAGTESSTGSKELLTRQKIQTQVSTEQRKGCLHRRVALRAQGRDREDAPTEAFDGAVGARRKGREGGAAKARRPQPETP